MTPVWRVPSTSPGPRSSRSFCATAKPSFVARSTPRRSRASSDSGGPIQQHAGRRLRPAPDAAAQLVQLRQAHALGVLDDHQRRVRHVDTDLDDRRRDEQIELGGLERAHDDILLRRLSCGRESSRCGRSAAPRRARARARSRRANRRARTPRSAGKPSRPAARLHTAPRRARRARRAAARARRRSCTGWRPGGSSPITEQSRSAYAVIASVRGIGVAVMISWCGTRASPSPFCLSRRRCSTPKRCCSSTMTSASCRNSTLSWNNACVPTTTAARPSATAASVAAASARRLRADQRRDFDAERREPALEAREMLLGEQLRRRHDGRLAARRGRDERRHRGHDRLAGADVALQQPVHRRAASRDRRRSRRAPPACAPRQRERQRGAKRVEPRGAVGQRPRALGARRSRPIAASSSAAR